MFQKIMITWVSQEAPELPQLECFKTVRLLRYCLRTQGINYLIIELGEKNWGLTI